MKKIIQCFFVSIITAMPSCVYPQGWYAEIDLELNHSLYAYENISNATVTFSGITVSGTSTGSNIHLVATGTGPVSGELNVAVTGTAWEPYDPNDPYRQALPIIRFTGNYDVPCITGFFEQLGDMQGHELYIWVKIHPRLDISDFVLLCEEVTLTSNTCSATYRWEVSDSPTGNFKTLAGKSTASISVTRRELIALGFSNPYGRKYFRVTGLPNTTSQLQPIDIFYPGPAASIEATSPTCHNGVDGSVALDIQSAFPGVIDDYVITLFEAVPPSGHIEQDYINNSAHKTFSGLSAGNYWVRIENNSDKDVYGNCWTDYAVGTLENPEPVTLTTSMSNYNGFGVRCSGSNDGRIEVTPSGGSGTYATFEWTPQVSTSHVATDLTAGTFTIKVIDTKGCESQSVTRTVTEPRPLSVEVFSSGGKNGYDVSCHDKADGMIETSVTGGVPAYTYLWSDRNITPWIKDVPAGEYTVMVRDANGCAAQAAIVLEAPAPINFDIDEISRINCPGDATGALEATALTNVIGQFYYTWSSGENDPAIFNKTSGSYTATVVDDQGCQATKTHVLTEPPVQTSEIVATSDYNGVAIECYGTATGELQAALRDPSGTVVAAAEYTWFRNGVLQQTGQNSATLKAVNAATYSVKIRNTEYCTTEATYVLQEPDPVKVTVDVLSDYHGVAISCSGKADGSIMATASGGTGGLSYKWSTGETTSALRGLPAGSYSVTATDINGCSAESVTVLNDPEPVQANIAILSNFNGAHITCADASDGKLSASANGGIFPYTFEWSNGSSGAELNNVTGGNYAVTATDANGCVSTVTSTVVAPMPLHAAIVDSSNYNGYGTACAGSATGFLLAQGSGGTGAYRYRWGGANDTTAISANLPKGTYTVEIQDRNGCATSTQATITDPPALVISTVTLKNISCYEGRDGQIELKALGGTGVYTYSVAESDEWQPDPALANLASGFHLARVRDSNGCTVTSTQTLTQPAPISIAFTDITPALCGDATGKISAIVSGGTGEYLYRWSDANERIVGTGLSASTLRAGIYTLDVTDERGCEAHDVAGITSSDGPKAMIAEVQSATCSYTADGRARIEVLDGDGPFSFSWDNGQTTPEAVDLRKGSYLVEITDINGCTTIESVDIAAPDSLTIELVEKVEPRCAGDCNGALSAMAKGGTGPYQYDWQLSSGPVLRDACAGEYVLKVSDQHACVAQKTFILTQPHPIALTAVLQQSPTCPEQCDGQLQLEAKGGTGELQFTWNDERIGPVLQDLCSGDFTTIIKDSRDCAVTETFTVTAPQITPPDLGGSVTLCEGQTHLLDAGPQWKEYAWYSSDGFEGDARTITLSKAGMYWLEANTAQGCVGRDTFLLQTSTDLLQANFLAPTEAFAGDTVVIIDISWPVPGEVAWNFPLEMTRIDGPADFVYAAFQNPGFYQISLAAALGACRDELTKTISILKEREQVPEAGRLGSEDFIKEFTLYPNPNDGMFDVVASLKERTPIVLTVWNTMTSTKIAQLQRSGKSFYREHIDLRPLSAGSYSLRLDFNKGTRYIRFIVR